MSGAEVHIHVLRDAEHPALFELFRTVVDSGDGYPQAPPLTWDDFVDYWLAHSSSVIVATSGERLVGAYYLKPNFVDRAAHIANAGYIVAAEHRGKGVGRALVEHSIDQARDDGYSAVMFNLVFESNPARGLYEELGWREIGRIPAAVEGEPAIIYWREV